MEAGRSTPRMQSTSTTRCTSPAALCRCCKCRETRPGRLTRSNLVGHGPQKPSRNHAGARTTPQRTGNAAPGLEGSAATGLPAVSAAAAGDAGASAGVDPSPQRCTSPKRRGTPADHPALPDGPPGNAHCAGQCERRTSGASSLGGQVWGIGAGARGIQPKSCPPADPVPGAAVGPRDGAALQPVQVLRHEDRELRYAGPYWADGGDNWYRYPLDPMSRIDPLGLQGWQSVPMFNGNLPGNQHALSQAMSPAPSSVGGWALSGEVGVAAKGA